MKSLHIYFVLVLMIIAMSCATKKELVQIPKDIKTPPVTGTYFWAVKPEVNMRDGNSTSASKIGKLNDGDSVLVSGNEDGWYQVHYENNLSGWIRSDLLGPKKVSVFANAVIFVDSLLETDGTELFFDKKLLHRRIYIAFPESNYTSVSSVEAQTKKLIAEYQAKVYRGDVTARVLKPNSQDEYLTLDIRGKQNPDIRLPVLPFGILTDVNNTSPEAIRLTINTPEQITDETILKTARNIVSIYPISYSKVELIFVSEQEICRLWFKEDEGGEDYKLNECPDSM